MSNFTIFCTIFLLFLFCEAQQLAEAKKKKCSRRAHGSRTFVPELAELDSDTNDGMVGPEQALSDLQQVAGGDVGTTFRTAKQDVYLWPSLTDREKGIIRDAFRQIHRRTCIRFNELDYKPWYHHERWSEGKPYVVIRKSKKFFGYSDNKIEGVNRRSLIYLSEKSLGPQHPGNSSRGMVMEQLLKFMGYREEYLRPDAPSYLKPIAGAGRPPVPIATPKFSNEQLMWPFDPESITMPTVSRDWFTLTIYCRARHNEDIGAGQRAGVLTRWDAVKLNSMYCPQHVGYADPRMGPCVVPRKRLCKDGENPFGMVKREISGAVQGCISRSQLLQTKQNVNRVGEVNNNSNDVNRVQQKATTTTTNNDGQDENSGEEDQSVVSAQDIVNFFNN